MKCIYCGKEFKETHGSQKYCSDLCRNEYDKERQRKFREAHKKPHEIVKCSECGNEFTAHHKGCKTCSPECANARIKRLKHERSAKTKIVKKNIHKPKTLSKIAAAARAEHMTYGQYVAKYGL